jgi:hypothetical protein
MPCSGVPPLRFQLQLIDNLGCLFCQSAPVRADSIVGRRLSDSAAPISTEAGRASAIAVIRRAKIGRRSGGIIG